MKTFILILIIIFLLLGTFGAVLSRLSMKKGQALTGLYSAIWTVIFYLMALILINI
jgi:hypothetical protein